MKGSNSRFLRGSRGVWTAFLLGMVLVAGWLGAGTARAAFDSSDNGNTFEIMGPIVALPTTTDLTGEWTVAKTKFTVTKDTKINQDRGKIAVGAVVQVKGTRGQNNALTATEIEVKLSPGSGMPILYTGKIETLPSTANRVGDWKVTGKTIHVTATTRIDESRAKVAVGATVDIAGLAQTDGSINAFEIEVRPDFSAGVPVKFTGKVEKLPSTSGRIGDWVISGRTVKVTSSTQLKSSVGDFMVGSLVDVEGTASTDGSITATTITNRGNVDNPQVTVVFRGTIETLPAAATFIGDWKVSGRTVRVSDKTTLNQDDGNFAVGGYVEVAGQLQADGVVAATKVTSQDAPNPPGFLRFEAKIVTLPSTNNFIGDWKVGDRTVHVASATKVDTKNGQVAVGALVEVEGVLRADGSVDASSIEVEHSNNDTSTYVRFFGAISALPATANLVGDWTIGGKTVHVADRTRIRKEHGTPAVGAYVEVEGNQRTDNTIDAFNIEVERDAGAPAGTTGFIDYYGVIKALPTAANFVGNWTVDAKTVAVADTTKIDTKRGAVAVGAYIEVYGYLLGDGSVKALRIEVKPAPPVGTAVTYRSYIELTGTIEKLPDDKNYIGAWTVSGKTVNVAQRTVVRRENAAVAVGATIELYGAELANGEIDAKFIEVSHSAVGASFQAFMPVASVSAGNYLESTSASSIIASFGTGLAGGAAAATTLPLPTTLGGVSVLVDGQPAGLFFVSPNQINYQVPDDLPPGGAQVTVQRDGNTVAQGTLLLDDVAPSIFTANASGQGVPAGTLLRVKANGQQSFEPLARFDGSKMVPVTITRQAGDQLFLILYGSGLRGVSDVDGNPSNGVAESVTATIGDVSAPVLFAGAAPGFAGLDQFNIQIPASASGANLTVTLKVNNNDGKIITANVVTISIQ